MLKVVAEGEIEGITVTLAVVRSGNGFLRCGELTWIEKNS